MLPLMQTGGGGGGTTLTGTGIARNTGACTELSGDATTSGSNAVTIKTNVALAGSPTTTTQSQGDNSTKIATTAYVDNSIAASPGYFFSSGIFNMGAAGSATNTTVATPNRVYALPFYLPFRITLIKATIGVGTASAGNSFNMALYDGSKNLVVDSGALSTTTGAGTAVSANINSTLGRGWYFFAWAGTSSTPTIGAFVLPGANASAGGVVAQPVMFFGANTLSGGAMPSSLGALSTISLSFQPTCLWSAF